MSRSSLNLLFFLCSIGNSHLLYSVEVVCNGRKISISNNSCHSGSQETLLAGNRHGFTETACFNMEIEFSGADRSASTKDAETCLRDEWNIGERASFKFFGGGTSDNSRNSISGEICVPLGSVTFAGASPAIQLNSPRGGCDEGKAETYQSEGGARSRRQSSRH